MSKNRISKLFSIVRSLDSYGHPINLTYNGDSTYKSTIGGLFTIFARIAILGYFVSELLNVVDKKSTVTVSEIIRDTALDKTLYNFTSNEFDMAVRLNYLAPGNEAYNEKLYRYAKVDIYKVNFAFIVVDGAMTYQQEFVPYKLEPCTDDRFMG